MNCPVCNRSLAPTLSICFTCGAMVNDSVREELQTKIGVSKKLATPRPTPIQATKAETAPALEIPVPEVQAPAKPVVQAPAMVVAKPSHTVELRVQKTSPTLVGFQAKNPTVPDWRLQLQNAVRTRKGPDSEPAYEKQLVTSGANALKPEYVEAPKPEIKPEHKNPRVAAALKRISASRSVYMNEGATEKSGPRPSQPNKSFPFNVVQRDTNAPAVIGVQTKATVNVPPKPRLVPTVVTRTGYDTNKLPPLAEPEVISSFDIPVVVTDTKGEIEEPTPVVEAPIAPTELKFEEAEGYIEELQPEEIEDLAPFSMRFNAGLFDFIIGSFASLLLLSPLAFFGGDWISFSGLLTFAATSLIVMFVYMTFSLGLYGKTFGMRMFSLELIDADENEYPTFHQAAVHSAAYLLSLPLLGVGFVTVLFNDEKRAAHDLLSGTIIVVEF